MTELKTLKDFEEGECESCALEYGAYQEGKKYPKRLLSEEDLRQEAIKWIRYIKKEEGIILVNPEDYPSHTNVEFSCVDGVYMFAQIQCIKHFFNITEEELK